MSAEKFQYQNPFLALIADVAARGIVGQLDVCAAGVEMRPFCAKLVSPLK